MKHRAYIEALTGEDPKTYARDLVEGYARREGERFGGRPAVSFRPYP
jgi:hypothetical protein